MPTQASASAIPAQGAAAVTPSDVADLTVKPCRALYIGVGGDVTLDTADADASILFKNVGSGAVLPVAAARVRATGTTATNIVALY